MTHLAQEIVYLVCFILMHHSFGFPDMVQEGGQLTPLTPLGSTPAWSVQVQASRNETSVILQ